MFGNNEGGVVGGGWCLGRHVERIRAQQGGSLQAAELCTPSFLAVEGSERGIGAGSRKCGEVRGRSGLGTSDVDGHESLAGAGLTGGRRQARLGTGRALSRAFAAEQEGARRRLLQGGHTSGLLPGIVSAGGSLGFQESSVLEGLGTVVETEQARAREACRQRH